MTLLEGVQQLKGRAVEIPGCHRNDLPRFFADMGYKVGAEIGVYKGDFTRKLCEAGLKMYGIDPWVAFGGQGRDAAKQERQNFIYDHASRNLAPFDCRLIRKTSMEAAPDFEDGSLDFVYIDGDHAFMHIAQDICTWEKKVRSGGVVSGHDYFDTRADAKRIICQVKSVVNAYTFAFGIENWWVFGQLDPELEPDRKERFRSWMWLKK